MKQIHDVILKAIQIRTDTLQKLSTRGRRTVQRLFKGLGGTEPQSCKQKRPVDPRFYM